MSKSELLFIDSSEPKTLEALNYTLDHIGDIFSKTDIAENRIIVILEIRKRKEAKDADIS